MIARHFTATTLLWGVLPLVAVLAPARGHGAPAPKKAMLVGTASSSTRRLVRRALQARQVRLVAPAAVGSRASAAPDAAQTVRWAARTLRAAEELYYAVKPAEAAALLHKEIPQLGDKLALADRFDLLRRLYLWQGVCHAKAGAAAASARAFAAAIQIADRGLDPRRFAPSEVAAFDAARTRAAGRPRGVIVLDVAPSSAVVIVDGKPVGRTDRNKIELGYGQYRILAKAVGYVSVVRRLDLQRGRLPLVLELQPAPRATIIRQLEQLRSEGKLDATRPDVASALGRLQGTREVLVIDERSVGDRLFLALARVRSADGQVLARTETVVNRGARGPAVRRLVGVLWPAPAGRARSRPLYKRWWVWTAVGLAVAGAVGISLAATSSPDTYTIKIAP